MALFLSANNKSFAFKEFAICRRKTNFNVTLIKLLQIEILCSEVAVDHLFKCMSRFPFPTENLPDGNRYTCFFINCKLYFPIRIIFFLPYSVLLSDTFLLPLCHSSKYWQSVAIPVFLSFHNPIA